MSKEQREKLVDDLVGIAATAEDARARVGAGRVLVAMDQLNQVDEQDARKKSGPAVGVQNNFYGSLTLEDQQRIDELAKIGLAKLGQDEDD